MNNATLKTLLAALAAGLLFGLGLGVSEMLTPARVLGFLDVTGLWDPTLAFVMGGALLVTFPAFRLAGRMQQPLFEGKFVLPTRKDIDAKLVQGAVLFGIGWGLAGLCPGPAVTGLASLNTEVLLFFVAMLAGMALHKQLLEKA
jgi:uncharacterized membrane protein YedE/YeeE